MFEIIGDCVTHPFLPTLQNSPATADAQKCNSRLLSAKSIVPPHCPKTVRDARVSYFVGKEESARDSALQSTTASLF
jgi:hypothetical protein